MSAGEFVCVNCNNIPDVSSAYLDASGSVIMSDPYLYRNDSGGIICRDCYFEGCAIADQITIFNLRNEVLDSHCHPGLQGFAIIKDNLFILCRNCSVIGDPGYYSFKKELPKSYLKIILENGINQDIYPTEYKKSWRNTLNSNAKDIYKCAVEKLFLDSNFPICTTHLDPAPYYTVSTFTFLCSRCNLLDDNFIYNFQDFQSELIAICHQFIKDCATTGSLPSFIVKCMTTGNYTNKNFFYDMKNLKSCLKQPLSETSCCLYCAKEFSYGRSYPIQLHNELKHEVCYKCYRSLDIHNSLCYIDNEHLSPNLIIANADFLFKKLKPCSYTGHEKSNMFSYYKSVPALYFCCNEYICSECIQSARTTGNIFMCPNCNKHIKIGADFDVQLMKYLKFTEIICEEHDQIVINYNPEMIKAHCKQCPKVMHKYSYTTLQAFNTALNSKLLESASSASPLAFLMLNEYFIYPISVKYRLYQYITNPTYEAVQRFNKILPHSINGLQKWKPKKNFHESIQVSCDSFLEMVGLLVGLSTHNAASVRVFTSKDGQEVANSHIENSYGERKYMEIPFNRVIIISTEPTEFLLEFGEGFYFQGSTAHRVRDLSFKDVKIHVGSLKFDNGNNIIGGPIIGFIFGNIYIKPQEALKIEE